MRKTVKISALLALIALSSCSGGGKFTGKWKRVNARPNEPYMIIKKNGESYDMYSSEQPQQFISFKYDQDHDVLTATQGGETIDIKYDGSNAHLKAGPRGTSGGNMEFEKLK